VIAIQDDAWHAHSEWKQLWAQFGCRRMHNEELIVAPCGIILAQQTFYGAEGINSVVVHHLLHLYSCCSLTELELYEECFS